MSRSHFFSTGQTFLLLTIFVLTLSPADPVRSADAVWVWQNPLPQGNQLHDVHFSDAMTGMAVGDRGTILRTENGGSSWVILPSGTEAVLYGVFLSSVTTATIVGEEGTILRTTDGGNTWTPQSSGTTAILKEVYLRGADEGFVVGWLGDGTAGFILRTLDGGDTWFQVPAGTPRYLEDVTFADENTGVAVGWSATIVRTVDGGDHWTLVTENTSSGQLFGVAFADANTGLAVGRSGLILMTWDGGVSWGPRDSGTSNWLREVAYLDATTAVAAGTDFFVSTNSGVTWTMVDNPAGVALNGITSPTIGSGVAVGTAGAILTSGDTGGTWIDQRSGFPGVQLLGVFFTDPATGIAVANPSPPFGGGSKILRTSDHGTTWTIQPSGTNKGLYDLSFSDATSGVAVGDSGTVLTTTDGGASWTGRASGVAVQLCGVSMLNASTGVAVGRTGTILRTDNGGINWTEQTSGTTYPLWDVCFVGENHVVVVGDYTILLTTDGGTTWSDVPHPMSNSWLYGVSFANANDGMAVGDLKTILRTTDGGATWIEQLSSGDDAEYFYSVAFADELNAIAVGLVAQGRVNCMRSTDGGSTWVAEPTLASRSLNDVFFDGAMATVVGLDGAVLRWESGTVAAVLQEYRSSWKQNHVEVCWRLIDIENVLSFEVARACGPREGFQMVHGALIERRGEYFVYEDHTAEPGKTYRYLVVIYDGGDAVASFETQVGTRAAALTLGQNHPNPFNPVTHIPFVIEEAGHVSLSMYDTSGRLVRTLVDRRLRPGSYSETWDGRNAGGERVASGVYFYRLAAGKKTLTRKALLLK